MFSSSSVTMMICSTYCFLRRIISTATPHEVPPPAVMPLSAFSQAARSAPAALDRVGDRVERVDVERLGADARNQGADPLAQLDRHAHRPRLVDQQRGRPLDPALGLDLGVGDLLERAADIVGNVGRLHGLLGLEGADACGGLGLLQLRLDQCLEIRVVEGSPAAESAEVVDQLLRAHPIDQGQEDRRESSA